MVLPVWDRHAENRIGVGSVTAVTVVTMKCRGFLKGGAAISPEMVDNAMGQEHGERRCDKGRCRMFPGLVRSVPHGLDQVSSGTDLTLFTAIKGKFRSRTLFSTPCSAVCSSTFGLSSATAL